MSLLGVCERRGRQGCGCAFWTPPPCTAPLSRRLEINQTAVTVVCSLDAFNTQAVELLVIIIPSIQLRSVPDDDH
jgi:hypothetical protein